MIVEPANNVAFLIKSLRGFIMYGKLKVFRR